MQARALSHVARLPKAKRLDAIAEGLDLLVEHVETLRNDLVCLVEAERPRASAIIADYSEEEAAKVLILLDLVRMGFRNQNAANEQLSRFYSHLARCIYAEVAAMRPASFGEVRSLVDLLRESHYLDGPNDVDWIFRNQLLTRREETLYVDYVRDEDGEQRWVTPAAYDQSNLWVSTGVQDLVVALRRCGCTSRPGLEVVARVWSRRALEDSTHWSEVAQINADIVDELLAKDFARPEVTTQDVHLVQDRWLFPMGSLDLSQIEVPKSKLEEQRDRRLLQEFGDLHG